MAYPFRYPHENAWMLFGLLSWARKMAPSQTP